MKSTERRNSIRWLMNSWLLLATVCLLLPQRAISCEFDLVRVASFAGAQPGYDVFNSSGTVYNTIVEVRRIDVASANGDATAQVPLPTAVCEALVQVSGTGTALQTGGSGRLLYGLSDSAVSFAIASTVSQTTGAMLSGDEKRLVFNTIVPAGQFVPNGEYVGELTVALGEPAGTLDALADIDVETSSVFSVVVDAATRVSFAGVQGRNRTVDFGEIETGSVPLFAPVLVVQSTSPYRLRFRSENQGRLVRETISTISSIPYNLNVAGQSINLVDPESDILLPSQAESRISLGFSIIDARNKRAGTYADRVVVDVTPMLQ